MKYSLFLDDDAYGVRDPVHFMKGYNDYQIATSFFDASRMINMYGCPYYISFDHDINSFLEEKEYTGLDFAKLIIEYDISAEGNFIPDDFTFHVHSANGIGAENILSLLNNYLTFRRENRQGSS